jgi:predicted DNA-binding transcriptional regulator AlpA
VIKSGIDAARKAAALKAKRRTPAVSAKLAAPPDVPANGKKKKKKYKKRTLDLASLHERLTHRVGLIDKPEILLITGVSFPTVWDWMRKEPPKFPRNRAVGGKSKWLAADIADWIAGLPVRALKAADALPEQDKQQEQFEPA